MKKCQFVTSSVEIADGVGSQKRLNDLNVSLAPFEREASQGHLNESLSWG